MAKIRVDFTIDGDEDEALYLVRALLDIGELQSAIDNNGLDVAPMTVTDAEASLVPEPPPETLRTGHTPR